MSPRTPGPSCARRPRLGFAARARATVVALACGALLAGPLAGRLNALPGAVPLYTVTDLTPNTSYSTALGINNRGQVVGSTTSAPRMSGPEHAVLYDSAGIHDLGTLGGLESKATAINDAGQITGYSDTITNPFWTTYSQHAFVYDATGMHDLGALGPIDPAIPGSGESWPSGISADGQIAGTAGIAVSSSIYSQTRAFLWQNGVMQPLNASGADAGIESWAVSINASGDILGQVVSDSTQVLKTFIWENGVARELPWPDHTNPRVLNDRGQILGIRTLPDQEHRHAMLYDGSGWHDLGTLGGDWSMGAALNNLGQVVGGSALDASEIFHPFLYTGGVMLNLDSLVLSPHTWDFFDPQAINDQGQIVGNATWHSQATDMVIHAVLLTPAAVPALVLSATTLDFSGQPAGAAQQVTLTNTGDAPLQVQGLTLTGADASSFQLAQAPGAATLAPGASQVVAITYTPATITGRRARLAAARTAAAGRTAVLLIQDNDPHPGAPHQVTLTALGAAPSGSQVPPAAPTGLTATGTAFNHVDLAWTDHSDNETAFAIWRQTGSGAFVRVGVVAPNTTHFRDTSVSPSTTYTYEVRATNNVGASAWSNRVSTLTPEAPPAAPTHLTATVVSAGEIDLTWTPGGGNETGIAIFRQAAGSDWERIGVVAPRVTRYADRSVRPGTSYTYQVRAHNSFLVSAWTNPVSALTPPAP